LIKKGLVEYMLSLELKKMAWRMRCRALKMALDAGPNGAHLGPAFSMMEITAVLFQSIIRMCPESIHSPNRDRFILSKAHAVLAYYTGLFECGIIDEHDLDSFEKNGSDFPGHPIMSHKIGVEFPGGSLGMGLPFAVGCAMAGKLNNQSFRTFAILGDGECNEGSVWEAAMAAAHYKLNRLCAVVDRNHLQYDGDTEDIMSLGDFSAKWSSFGWDVKSVDGHDVEALLTVFASVPNSDNPLVVIAETVKGKGVSFMENNREWHHGRLSSIQYDEALRELNEYASEEFK